jgi:hypothetical protein
MITRTLASLALGAVLIDAARAEVPPIIIGVREDVWADAFAPLPGGATSTEAP